MIAHHMRLHPQPFRDIAEGKKTHEFRLNDEKRRTIRVGDEIEFESRENSDRLTAAVVSLERFPTFGAMYDALPQEARDGRKRADWIASFREYYSEDEERENGTLMITFRLKP